MGKVNKSQKKKTKIGESGFLNKKCWLVKNLNYAPYRRCQYCGFRFRNCLFLQYQMISSILIISIFLLFLFIEGQISTLMIISIFALVIVYGYFFNNSTERIIKANFIQKEAKDALEELTEKLEERVGEQTKDIKEKSKYLQELLNMKSDFLRVVNHQLNTPLSVMKGYFSMLKEDSYPLEKAMPPIENGLERISSTVSDFWTAYELEGERMRMSPQKTDIAEIVERLISEKQKMQIAKERRLKISVKKPDFEIPLAWCDYKKTAHVISNLLDNAVYYTRKGGVSVYYELAPGNHLKINVKDSGAGISSKDRDKLFQKFSRGQDATNLHPDGSGLGLYIAKKIVEGNDGEMTFFSAGAKKGSIFSFTVPIYKNQRANLMKERPAVREKIVIFNK